GLSLRSCSSLTPSSSLRWRSSHPPPPLLTPPRKDPAPAPAKLKSKTSRCPSNSGSCVLCYSDTCSPSPHSWSWKTPPRKASSPPPSSIFLCKLHHGSVACLRIPATSFRYTSRHTSLRFFSGGRQSRSIKSPRLRTPGARFHIGGCVAS